MWSDNESDVDLLGFWVHTRLLSRLVTDTRMLPVAVGVFGDWGGGKSSILRQLQRDLNAQSDVACLTFNGWVFEGYDDAKAALISAILVQLGEHQRIGPKIRSKVASLLKRVDYMRFARVLGRLSGPVLAGAATGMAASFDAHHGTSLAPTVASMAAGMANAGAAPAASGSDAPPAAVATEEVAEVAGAIDWPALIAKAPGSAGPLDIRTFRDEFARLIEATDLRALVVVIDDLDRCSPERLIENLEAIKLFLATPRTAFVIAADERIVRHAIRERYVARNAPGASDGTAADEPYDLVRDYLEKVIQVPYHLPRLSPSEVETYMTLLYCQLLLDDEERFTTVLAACTTARAANLSRIFGLGDVQTALGATGVPPELERGLQWISGIAPALTEGLKGNPRQVKRFLNALLLRRQLAEVADLALRDEVLVKLMLLEYLDPSLFDELYGWQAVAQGHPPELATLEAQARGEEHRSATEDGGNAGDAGDSRGDGRKPPRRDEVAARRAEGTGELPTGASARWQAPALRIWLALDPPLADVDLRDYFWVARDRLHGSAAQFAMVPPYVRRLFEQLLSDVAAARTTAAAEAHAHLTPDETAALLGLLESRLRRHPEEFQPIDGLRALVDAQVEGAVRTLLDALRTVAAGSLQAAVAYTLSDMKRSHPDEAATIDDLLRRWAEQYPQTRIGRAAAVRRDETDGRSGGGFGKPGGTGRHGRGR